MIEGIFHADPHPRNVLLLADGQLAPLDLGCVGRMDAGLRGALQRLLLASDRGDAAALRDALLEIVRRPDELDEPALERALGVFMSRHVAAGITPDARMFTDLFRIVAEYELSVPPEIAGAFRALGTIEGTLTQLAPGFDVLTQARRFATDHLAEHLSPACLAATLGVMSVLMLGLHGGPSVTHRVTLYAFFGYCRLVFAGILALRVLALSSGRTQAEGPMSHGSRVDQQTASTSGNRQLDVGPGGNRASLSPATEPARLVLLRLPALDQDRFSQRRRNLL